MSEEHQAFCQCEAELWPDCIGSCRFTTAVVLQRASPLQSIGKTKKMQTHWILVGLLSLCSLSFSQECSRGLQENMDFPGTDITFLYSPDVEHCQQLCTQHPSCLFFTYIRADWTKDNRHFHCYLKSTPSGQPRVQTPLIGVTSGFSLKPCNPQPNPCLPQVYQNVDFLGADYRFLFTADYEECQRVCTQDPNCQFFTFVNGVFTPEKIRFKCHLKYSWTGPRTPLVNRKAGVFSGFSHNLQITQYFTPACQSKFFAKTDIPGNDLETLPAASAEHCQALCSVNPRCTYFSFVSNNFHCILKNNPNEMVIRAKEGVTSGLPVHFCQLDNSWLKVQHEGVDFQGSDIRFELMNDPFTCEKICSADPNCQFYTYVNENFRDPVHRRRCYLKRVITMPAPPRVNKLQNVVSGFSLKSCVSSALHTQTR
ncbi:plasma kallikrein-like isoform X2 [Seriola aureovittata]|uniref:plasma kallikrein-like isoform X2 n=1 Tax=Seriola aureovittata TaxID=2871759 RepID=UPI0024BDD109|nr:plasma kallikrein-like isoform X2 [Seriola aureovittata]